MNNDCLTMVSVKITDSASYGKSSIQRRSDWCSMPLLLRANDVID